MDFFQSYDDISTDESDVFGFLIVKDLGPPLGPTGESIAAVNFTLNVAGESSEPDPNSQSRVANTSINGAYILAFITFPLPGVTYELEGIATTSSVPARVLAYTGKFQCTP